MTRSRRVEILALGVGTAVLCLLPYLTIGLAFQTALYVQAIALLAVLLLLLAAGLLLGNDTPLRSLTTAWKSLPRSVAVGLGLYAGAAILGTAVGLATGASLRLLAGQTLSLLLLPLGAAVGALLGGHQAEPGFRRALTGSVALASLFHLVHVVGDRLAGEPTFRFYMDNSISAAGLALLAFPLALVAVSPVGRERGAWPVLLGILLMVLGSGARGLWLTLIPALALTLVLGQLVGRPTWRS